MYRDTLFSLSPNRTTTLVNVILPSTMKNIINTTSSSNQNRTWVRTPNGAKGGLFFDMSNHFKNKHLVSMIAPQENLCRHSDFFYMVVHQDCTYLALAFALMQTLLFAGVHAKFQFQFALHKYCPQQNSKIALLNQGCSAILLN